MTRATSVDDYIESVSEDRRSAIETVRRVILDHLPRGYAECMQAGMIAYVVPHEHYPPCYHCDPRQPLQYATLASRKSHMSLHLMVLYGDAEFQRWLRKAWGASGKKLDVGKACIRFKTVEDLPLDVVAQAVTRVPVSAYVARLEKFAKERQRRR